MIQGDNKNFNLEHSCHLCRSLNKNIASSCILTKIPSNKWLIVFPMLHSLHGNHHHFVLQFFWNIGCIFMMGLFREQIGLHNIYTWHKCEVWVSFVWDIAECQAQQSENILTNTHNFNGVPTSSLPSLLFPFFTGMLVTRSSRGKMVIQQTS